MLLYNLRNFEQLFLAFRMSIQNGVPVCTVLMPQGLIATHFLKP